MYSRDDLSHGFRRLGVTAGDTIMLHASIRAVGAIAGGPDQIHLALKDTLTDAGTLLMYASCPEFYDEVGRGHLTADQEREILDKLPPFDARTARAARDNGALVELFRTYPGSIVNSHVARFVVWGRRAAYLVSSQPWDYAFGHGSVLDRFVTEGGKVLLLGCDHDTVTFLHYAEHIVDIPGKRVARFKVPIDDNGVRVWRDMEEFDTSDQSAHPSWPDRFFSRITDGYIGATGDAGGRVGNAESYLLDAAGLLSYALDAMTRAAGGG